MGYHKNTRYFVLKTKDTYIRRILQAEGWIENPVADSAAFHLKWAVSDGNQNYSELFEGEQFYNHFPNSLRLTTKIGLHKHFYRP